jgi:glycosyltransferase involved in cell wall biosynthesis
MKGLIKAMPLRVSKEMEMRKWRRALRECPLFSANWYLTAYPDVRAAGVDPLKHYLTSGWRELRAPSPEFDGAYYLTRYPDIATLDIPPLVHYWLHGRFEGRHLNSSLDLEWISTNYRNGGASHPAALPLLESDETPVISVIIPTYNRLGMLPDVIAAWRQVDSRTAFRYEIIFSDDGSADGTVAYLESIQDLPLVVLKNTHGGASKARNAAIRAATGRRLLIIGDDIFPDAEILNIHAKKASELGANVATLGVVDWAPNLVVNHLMEHITEIGNEQFSYNRLPDESFVDFRHFYTCNICVDREMVVKNEIIFDDRFDEYGFEDIELGYRLALQGMKIFYTTAAKGDHYHPYIVEGFCKRQIRSGRMAIVFREAHPGVSRILGIDILEKALADFPRSGQRYQEVVWNHRVAKLVSQCNYLESLILTSARGVRSVLGKHLSFIYSTLFRAMYEFGVLQKISGKDDVLSVAMSRHFSEEWDKYWSFLDSKENIHEPLSNYALTSVIDAYSVNNPEILPAPASNGLYRELCLVKSLMDRPIPLQRRRAMLQRKATMALYYLVRDPRYLFRRLHEHMTARNTARLAKASGERNNIIQDDSSVVVSKLGLIIERANDDAASIVELFRLALGPNAPVFYVEEFNKLVGMDEQSNANIALAYFWPTTLENFPHPDNLISAWVSLVENSLDLTLISYSLNAEGLVGVSNVRDQMIFSGKILSEVLNNTLAGKDIRGKIIRTMPAADHKSLREVSLNIALGCEVEFSLDHCFFSKGGRETAAEVPRRLELPRRERNRPLVFVFPIFAAVGGVERNTIEIIRKLNSHYDFVVITMERLRVEQGSLVNQFREAGANLFEMSEIVPHDDYLKLLLKFKKWMSPDIIWVCNGSPWFCDNASNIRSLFYNTPIVDQEVYDVSEGWINRYSEPGIQSFDRFIAINSKIKDRFIGELQIDETAVDLIYSAVDVGKIVSYKALCEPKEETLRRWDLPENKKLFTFVGRLTAQKRPLEFLKIAYSRLSEPSEVYVLVGDGELASECDNFITSFGLKNVIRIPFVDNTLALASVTTGLVITSAYEGLPIAMIEALNFGVPVFATDTGDIRLVVENYAAGVVIPVTLDGFKRAEAFNDWVQAIPKYRASLEAFEHEILARFSSDNISSQYIDCFNKASLPYLEKNYE